MQHSGHRIKSQKVSVPHKYGSWDVVDDTAARYKNDVQHEPVKVKGARWSDEPEVINSTFNVREKQIRNALKKHKELARSGKLMDVNTCSNTSSTLYVLESITCITTDEIFIEDFLKILKQNADSFL